MKTLALRVRQQGQTDVFDVLKQVILEYKGWTMFCIVIIVLAISHRIETPRK